MLKSYLLDFQVCHKAASVWWTCPYNNNLMKHFIWKWRKYNVMKNKTISSIKYICHNKQLKNLHKVIPMNINQQIITLNIQKTPDWHFLVFFLFLNSKLWSLMSLYLLNLSVCCSIPIGYHLLVHNYHVLKFENNFQVLMFLMFLFFFNFWTQNKDIWWITWLLNSLVCCSILSIKLV